jgi:predicted DNA binding CopG/RHH family protein
MKKDYNFSKLKETKNPYSNKKKKAVGINLSPSVIDYFKELSEETGVSYQKLIDLYLLDCVKNKKRLQMKWTA